MTQRIDYEITGRNGALTTYRIFGDAELVAQIASTIHLNYRPSTVEESEIRGKGNRADIDTIDRVVTAVQIADAKISNAQTRPAESPRRTIVRAGSVKVGDTVEGSIVVGLGRSWHPFDHSAIGVPPYWDEVQYAYFS